MPLKLMYITNNENIACIAESSGVDWIFIDLEVNGKYKRQGHLDTVISKHSIKDIRKIKNVLSKSELLVRINPIFQGTKYEIDDVINNGADIIMLPFFKSYREVEFFINYVNGRAKTCLLCETPEAVNNIDEILAVDGIDYIHIGLNDLHIGYGMKFMFEPLANGTVHELCSKIAFKNISYGFGGIAQLGLGVLPAEHILAEHYRLGSDMVILSRSFCNESRINDFNEIKNIFKSGVEKIRMYENKLLNKDSKFFLRNNIIVKDRIMKIINDTAV